MVLAWMFLSFIILTGFLALRVPVAVGVGAAALLFMYLSGNISRGELILPLTMVYGVNSFTILTIPLFVWVGQLISHEVISEKLFGQIRQAVGWWRGGMLQFNMLLSGAFSAMSGSAVADAAGPSRAIYYASVDAGYPKGVAAAATAVSSILAVIIPPSIPLVLWGVAGDVSIGRLWAGGILPGLLLLSGFMAVTAILAYIKRYPRESFPGWRPFLSNVWSSLPVLFAALIIWGGVFGGIFTPTEAAAVAVVYLILVSSIIYRLNLGEHIRIMIRTLEMAAAVLIIVAVANYFAWLMSYTRAPAYLVDWILHLTSNRQVILLLIALVLLVLGCFMDTTALILITAPVVAAVGPYAGIEPVHLGLVSTLAIVYGLLTPPFGMLLFVLQRATGVGYVEIIKNAIPYYSVLAAVLLATIFFPEIVTYIPNLIFGK